MTWPWAPAHVLACCFAQERVAKLTSGVSAAAAANLEQVVWPTPLEEGARSSSSGAASTDGLPGPPMASQSSLDDGPLSRLSSDSLNDAPVDDLDDVNDGPRPHWPRSPPSAFLSAFSMCWRRRLQRGRGGVGARHRGARDASRADVWHVGRLWPLWRHVGKKSAGCDCSELHPGWPADRLALCQDLGMGMGTESVDETRESAAPMEDSAPAPMDSAPMVEAATASTDAAADL